VQALHADVAGLTPRPVNPVAVRPTPSAGALVEALPSVVQARRGGLRDTDAIDLLATLFKAVLAQTGVEAGAIGDVVVGSVLGPSSQRANEARMAMFFAGAGTPPLRSSGGHAAVATRGVRLAPRWVRAAAGRPHAVAPPPPLCRHARYRTSAHREPSVFQWPASGG